MFESFVNLMTSPLGFAIVCVAVILTAIVTSPLALVTSFIRLLAQLLPIPLAFALLGTNDIRQYVDLSDEKRLGFAIAIVVVLQLSKLTHLQRGPQYDPQWNKLDSFLYARSVTYRTISNANINPFKNRNLRLSDSELARLNDAERTEYHRRMAPDPV